jgi:hypothetical protein
VGGGKIVDQNDVDLFFTMPQMKVNNEELALQGARDIVVARWINRKYLC